MTTPGVQITDGPITGGCLCRAVRYRIDAAPIVARVCWCRVCQYLAAGSGTVNVCFPADALKVEGQLSEYRNVADSGNHMRRRFCPACGTPMFSAADSRPHLIFVRAGTLDDSALVKPASTIWASKAPAWASIDTSLPTVAAQPPPAG